MKIDGFNPCGFLRIQRPTCITHTTDRVPVAARVSSGVEFETPSIPGHPGTLSFYTRAADRVEAAINDIVGQHIDVRG